MHFDRIFLKNLILLILAWLFLFSISGPAAEPIKKKDQELSLEERVEILTEELENLKLKKATKQYKSAEGLGPAASGVYGVKEGFSIGGYGELQFTDYRSAFVKDEADVKRFVLYTGYKFSDFVIFNSEIEYEHAGFENNTFVTDVNFEEQKIKTKDNNKSEVFVEFAYIDLMFADWAKLALGLHLVPFGITNYMHEPTTFYSVNRPRTERDIIPTTWREMGFLLRGKILDGLTYRLGILNGPRGIKFSESSFMRGGRGKGSKVRAEDPAYILNFEYKGLSGLLFGISYYAGNSGQGEIEKVDWRVRIEDPLDALPDSDFLSAYNDYSKNRNKSGRVRVQLVEAHFRYELGPLNTRGLITRGWLDEEDARSVNRATDKNIGLVVQGGYLELGVNLMSFFKSEKKLILFVRTEALNTQQETVRRYRGGKEDVVDYLCDQILAGTCKTTTNIDLGIIENKDESKELYGVRGVPDRVNARRIVTTGLAFYPHPNVVLKLDYEKWDSKSDHQTDIEWRNSGNNKIDRMNFGVGFIF